IRKTNNGNYLVDTDEEKFTCSAETHFYNSFRLFKLEHGLGKHLPMRSHTFAYNTRRKLTPTSFLLIGGGRSAIWLAKHFPDKLIVCVVNKKDKDLPLFKEEESPPNLIILLSNEFNEKNGYKLQLESIGGSFRCMEFKWEKNLICCSLIEQI
ncbi:unnamed protein product, partial [marine sediment metagenome]